jgi:hypothetical protein
MDERKFAPGNERRFQGMPERELTGFGKIRRMKECANDRCV